MRTKRWLAAAVLVLAACSEPQEPAQTADPSAPAADLSRGSGPGSERAELLAADRAAARTAARKGVTAGLLDYLADDAYFLFPGENTVRGRTSAQAILAANFDGGTAMPWTPLFADVSADARVGYTFGTLELTQDGAHLAWGKYITAWRRARGGWKMEALNLVFYRNNVTLTPHFPHPDRAGHFPPLPERLLEGALLRTDARFAQAAVDDGPAAAFRRFADENATTMGNPDWLVGRAAIFAGHQGGDPADKLTWVPAFAGAGPLGDLGFTIGDAKFFVGATGESFYSKYLTIWRRQANGNWKYVQDGGSPSPAPTP